MTLDDAYATYVLVFGGAETWYGDWQEGEIGLLVDLVKQSPELKHALIGNINYTKDTLEQRYIIANAAWNVMLVYAQNNPGIKRVAR